MIWVLMIFLSGTVQESVYFNDMDTCLNMHTKSDTRTGRNPWQVTKSGLKPIAFLKEWMKKKDKTINVPKYLTGKEKNNGKKGKTNSKKS